MNKILQTAKKYGTPIFNFTKAIVPFAISRSEELSEEFAKHKARLATVDALKEILVNEIRTLQSIQEDAFTRYINSDDDLERVRLKRDIEDIDRRKRALTVGQGALLYMPEPNEHDSVEEAVTGSVISSSWLDRFHEFAKLNNEAWREELLAKALAREAISPGSVSPRALWLIGTLEEDIFHAIAALLDISIIVGGTALIPNGKTAAVEVVIPDCVLGKNTSVGTLAYMVDDVRLISNTEIVAKSFKIGSTAYAEYGREKVSVQCKDEALKIKGIIYTPLGLSVASFYDTQVSDIGYKILHDWLDSLHKVHYDVSPLTGQS